MPYQDEYPGNIVEALAVSYEPLPYVTTVLRRPLRPNDPNGALGISAMHWTPQEWQIGQFDPATSRYLVQIEALMRHASQEAAMSLHNQTSKSLRVMLYRDVDLRARLLGLSESSAGVTERVQKYGVENQRFAWNEVGNEYLFYSVLTLWVETEIV